MNDSGLPSLDVPRPHRSEIANQEHAVRNHRISKRSFGIWSNLLLRWLRGWREPPLLTITGGCCFNQRDVPVESVQIQQSIGRGNRCPTNRLRLPRDFSGGKLSRNELLSDFRSVNVIADNNSSADTIR